jgi:hypothetical protein
MLTSQPEPESELASGIVALAVGSRVECRPVRFYDDLYWLGTVTKVNEDGSYSVQMENGDTEPRVPACPRHILAYNRRTVFEGREVVVQDGHTLVPGVGTQGGVVPVRLLSFKSSPHLYQSGCLLASSGGDSSRALRWSPVAFEIIQAMITSMAFLGYSGGGSDCGAARQYDSAWIGGGSGSCPMTARKLFAPLLRRIDVVELNPEVMQAARQHFGLAEDEVVRCHVGDGSAFVTEAAAGSYDLVAIDAADHDASNGGPGLIAPPECLCSEEFLAGALRPCLRPGGFAVVRLFDFCGCYAPFAACMALTSMWGRRRRRRCR